MEVLHALSPAGGDVVRQQGVAPRIGDLNGRAVGEVWNGVFKGDQTFPLIRALLKASFPRVKIIPYTEFPFRHGGDNPSDQKRQARELAELAKAKGCDALI